MAQSFAAPHISAPITFCVPIIFFSFQGRAILSAAE